MWNITLYNNKYKYNYRLKFSALYCVKQIYLSTHSALFRYVGYTVLPSDFMYCM